MLYGENDQTAYLGGLICAFNSLKHRHPPKTFRRVFHSVLEVFHHRLHTDRFFDLSLCLDVVGIGVQVHHLTLSL